MRPRRSSHFAASNTAIALGWAVLAVACGGSDDAPEAGAVGDSAAAPVEEAPPTQLEVPALGTPDYVGLEDGNISFHLHWVNGPVSKEALAGTAPPTLESVRTAAGMTFDRVMFRFAGAELPGYELAWTSAASEGCRGGGTPPEGEKHLRVRLRPVNTGGRVAATVATDLMNVESAAQTCAEDGQVEWHIGVGDSAQVRVIEMRQPPRLIVDVREPDRMPAPTPRTP